MAKKVIGFNSEDDFERMSRSVRKSESVPQVGQRQRAKYPIGGGGPTLKRAVISELGDYDVHRVTLISGTFTEDLETDDLAHTRQDVEAYVAEEIVEYKFEVGDIVLLAKFDSRYWIIEAKQNCVGYCIDPDFSGNGYVYGWSFRAPNLPCCPEASGTHLLTTSDSGVTYETSTFQCNSDGTDRKWIYTVASKSLRISPMLDEGRLEWRTDNAPDGCTVRLQQYEQQLFANRADCGKIPKSVCLNPMCGVGTCSECSAGLSPMAYVVEIGEGGQDNAGGAEYDCDKCSGTYTVLRTFDSGDSDMCAWVAIEDNGEVIRIDIIQDNGTDYLMVECGITLGYWGIEVPTDCTKQMTLNWIQPTDPARCINQPDTITVTPVGLETLEGNCYPKSATSNDILVPYYLEFELTGITDGTCDQCSAMNGIQRLALYNRNSPAWEGDDITGDCLSAFDATPSWRTYYDSGPDFDIILRFGNGAAFYTGPALADINYDGPNEFTYTSDNGECDNWPASITVYPLAPTA